MHHDGSLHLVPLGGARPFRCAGIEHGRGERAAAKVGRQHLMAVDVSGEDSVKTGRDGAAGNHVGSVAENIPDRTDGRPFDGLMETKQPQIGLC